MFDQPLQAATEADVTKTKRDVYRRKSSAIVSLEAAYIRGVLDKGWHPVGGSAGLCLESDAPFIDQKGAKQPGTNRWVLRLTVLGRRRDIGLGGYPLVPLTIARVKAMELRRAAKDDIDPIAQRRKEREGVPSFKEAAEKVFAGLAPNFKNQKHSDH